MSRVCVLLWLCLASPVLAATVTVTNISDSGGGSLRDAISNASPGDTIFFTNTLAGRTIYLTNGELLISVDLKMDASALSNGVIIDAGKNSRVLEIAADYVTLNSIILTNGFVSDDGGGILVNAGATLIADNSTISGNSANGGGGIRAITGSTVTLNNCILSGNFAGHYGGGIFNDDSFTLNDCILSSNSTANGFGGGIFDNGGTITLNKCTLSGNSSASQGDGGGIDIYFGTAALNNCTFSSNSAADGGGIFNIGGAILNNCSLSDNSGSNGGGLANSGTITLNNCTLFGNSCEFGEGGGVYNEDVLTLNNCTLSGNSAYSGGGILLTSDTLTPLLINTIVAGNIATFDANISGDFSGVGNLTNANPQLAPLGNYGGPTQTMPPLPGSPAIDAGDDLVTNFLPIDQRGNPRLSGAHADIGAVEVQFVAADTNNPPVLTNSSWSSVGGTNTFQFAFTNVSGADFTVLATTNLTLLLANWIVLGNVPETSSGRYQFIDLGATNSLQRFYRVVSP